MSDWGTVLKTNYEQLLGYLIAYVPQVLGAIILLLVGWIIARVLARLTRTFVAFIGRMLGRLSQTLALKSSLHIRPNVTRIISRTVFWLIMVFFFAAALSSLGVDFIATWLRELLSYLPNIFASAVVVIAGFIIGGIARTMSEAAIQGTGLKHGQRIGLMVKWLIIGIAIVIGIEQLGMNIQFITTLVVVELAVFSLGIALAYGLGSYDLVKNLVGSRQAGKQLNIGEYIKLGGYEGKLIRMNQSSLELETEGGKVIIPARLFNECPCVVISGSQIKGKPL